MPIANVAVTVTGELAALGGGTAQGNQAESITIIGGGPEDSAELYGISEGASVILQDTIVYQGSDVESASAASVNDVAVAQLVVANESLDVISSGEDINVFQGGSASFGPPSAAEAQNTSTMVAGDTSILINQ